MVASVWHVTDEISKWFYFNITAYLDTIHTVMQPAVVIQTSDNSLSTKPTDEYSIAIMIHAAFAISLKKWSYKNVSVLLQ